MTATHIRYASVTTASLSLVVLSLLSLLLLQPTAAVDLSFSADISAPPTPLLPTVYDSFGSSHGSTTLRATWRSHFTATHRDIPFLSCSLPRHTGR